MINIGFNTEFGKDFLGKFEVARIMETENLRLNDELAIEGFFIRDPKHISAGPITLWRTTIPSFMRSLARTRNTAVELEELHDNFPLDVYKYHERYAKVDALDGEGTVIINSVDQVEHTEKVVGFIELSVPEIILGRFTVASWDKENNTIKRWHVTPFNNSSEPTVELAVTDGRDLGAYTLRKSPPREIERDAYVHRLDR